MLESRRGLWFKLTVDATHELAREDDRVGALVTVAARQGERGAVAAAAAAEIIIMDRSLSMAADGKLPQAKQAVQAAIDALADGTYFAVIAGNHAAKQLYPGGGRLQRAASRVRAEAKVQVSNMDADGGTAMSTWLTLAAELFEQVPDTVRHAVLYTDGINESERPDKLKSALRACRDRFICDVRGVGKDWNQRQLQRIADALQGQVAAIINIGDLREDYTRLMEHAQGRIVSRAYLRLRLDRRFELESIRQTMPTQNDLTGHCLPQDGGVIDVPLLGWGEESRDYLLVLSVDHSALPFEEVRAARVDIVAEQAGDKTLASCATPVPVVVKRLPYRGAPDIPESVTRAGDMVQLAGATRAGVDAYERGDQAAALRELTIAVDISRRLGATAHLGRLMRLVTIDEFERVRLRPDISQGDLLITRTGAAHHHDVPVPGAALLVPPPAEQVRVTRTCPRGHKTTGRVVRHCEEAGCDHEFNDDADPDQG